MVRFYPVFSMAFFFFSPIAVVGTELANTAGGTGGNDEKRKTKKRGGFEAPLDFKRVEASLLPARQTRTG